MRASFALRGRRVLTRGRFNFREERCCRREIDIEPSLSFDPGIIPHASLHSLELFTLRSSVLDPFERFLYNPIQEEQSHAKAQLLPSRPRCRPKQQESKEDEAS